MVETKDLVKVYRTGGVRFEALRGVSLKIKKGELVSILGPSGSGKSTLLHIMGLLDRPSSGRVYIEGKDTSKIDEKGLAEMRNRRIGFVFQAFNLIHRLNSVENIELPLISQGIDPVSRREHAVKMLDMVGLASKSLNRPAELSGGEQQRVAIARALVTNPAIVLADEPTGNLDSKTAMQIMDIVGKVNESLGTSFVIVTHNFEVAARTHRRIILRDGQVEREEDV
ncbi:ABC transporter ATP-binding protein [Candidatus Bathyarchaeota archaeon]|nr:ABC transporter ATP-binding protein [Candidatus Bathyarchaeota archaeon]